MILILFPSLVQLLKNPKTTNPCQCLQSRATLRIIWIIECKYNRISGMEIFAPENTRRWVASQQYSTQAFTFTCSWFAMWLYLLFCRGTTAVVSSEAWPLIQWTTGERDAEETVCPVFNKLSQPMSFRFPPLEVLYERICRLCFCWGLFLLAWQPMIIILFFLSHNRDPRVSVGATAARDDHDNRCSINYNIRVQADINGLLQSIECCMWFSEISMQVIGVRKRR